MILEEWRSTLSKNFRVTMLVASVAVCCLLAVRLVRSLFVSPPLVLLYKSRFCGSLKVSNNCFLFGRSLERSWREYPVDEGVQQIVRYYVRNGPDGTVRELLSTASHWECIDTSTLVTVGGMGLLSGGHSYRCWPVR